MDSRRKRKQWLLAHNEVPAKSKRRRVDKSEAPEPLQQNITPPSLLDTLLPELKTNQLLPNLPLPSIGAMRQVSKHWYGFLSQSHNCQRLIERDFGISIETLNAFLREVEARAPGTIISFATIHESLHHLSREQHKELKKIIGIYSQPQYIFGLLACCANASKGKKLIEAFIPQDERTIWRIMSVAARAHCTFKQLNNNLTEDELYGTANFVFQSNNPYLGTLLFDPAYHFNSSGSRLPLDDALNVAANDGNFLLFQFVISMGIQPSNHTVRQATLSGNLEMVRFLMDKKNHFKFDTSETYFWFLLTISMLRIAVSSGNLEMLKFWHKRNRYTEEVNSELIYIAAQTGNQEMTLWLINKCHHTPDECIVVGAAESGDLEFLIYLIKHYALALDQETLAKTLLAAVRSGNLEMVKYLISEHNAQPNQETFNEAYNSNNLALITYLADTFNFRPDRETFDNFFKPLDRDIALKLLASVDPFSESVISKDMWSGIADDFYPLSNSLVEAIDKVHQALDCLRHYHANEGRKHLLDAAQLSWRQFFTLTVQVVQRADELKLDARQVDTVLKVMRKTLAESHSYYEEKAVQQLLADSADERLQGMVDLHFPSPFPSPAASL